MATHCTYLTARCPHGCEVWLHPKAVVPHGHRCEGVPWTDHRRPITEVLLAEDAAELARSFLPPEVLHRPEFSDDRLLRPKPGMYLRVDVVAGVVVRSPLAEVSGRRWWTVVRTAAEVGRAIDAAFDAQGFERLEHELGTADTLVRCEVCGDDVSRRGLRNHQARNSVCRSLANVTEVRTFWDLGYRDPYGLRDRGVPLTWAELNGRVHWRNRLHVIPFRLWTAVLISTKGLADRRGCAS